MQTNTMVFIRFMGDLKHYITDTDLHIVPFTEIRRDFIVDDGFQASNMGAEEK